MENSFRFDHVRLAPMQQIGLHEHPEWELSLVIKGRGVRTVGDLDEPFSPGDVVLVPPGVRHCWRFSEDGDEIENITVLVSQGFIDAVSAALPQLRAPLEQLSGIETGCSFTGVIGRRFAECLSGMVAQSDAMRAVSLLRLLVVAAEGGAARMAGRPRRDTDVERRLKKIEIFVTCNSIRKVTIDDIAAHVGMNRSSLCTFFRRRTGMTVVEYVNHMRLDNARRLLADTPLTVQQVCYGSGFQDVPYFCRIFKRAFGLTPSEYRHRGSL